MAVARWRKKILDPGDKPRDDVVGLFKSTSIVSAMTMFSRSLGFVRDMLMASLFGATAGFDAFLVAFKIPNFMRALFSDGSFSQALVPVLAEHQEIHEKTKTLKFMGEMLGSFIAILLLITIICEILTPVVVIAFAPGFLRDPVRYQMAMHMLHITFPYMMLISITAFFGSVLNSYGHFATPSFTPVLLNIILLIAAYFSFIFPVREEALAWGVFAAGVIQLLFQLPFLFRYKLLAMPRFNFKDERVRKVLKNLLPALFGVSVVQVGLLLNTLFGSFLKEGSISWLYYADRLTFFPLGIFGVALATVVLPHLSNLHTKSMKDDFSATLDWSFRLLFIISIPATLGLLIMAGPLTVTLFKHGQFTLNDVMMTRQSIMAFCLGLPAFMAIKILAAAFYSRQDLKRPVKIALFATISNIFLSSILIFPLAHTGLALSTSISAIINAFLLYVILKKESHYKSMGSWKKFLLQLLFANGMMTGLLLWTLPATNLWVDWNWHMQVSRLFFWMFAASITYFSCLWLGGLRIKDVVTHKGSSFSSDKIIIQH